MTDAGKLARDSLLSAIFYVAPRVANVLLFVFVGRRAGPTQAGIFALANTFLIIATTSMRGLDELVVRQVAREPEHSGRYLANFTFLRLSLSLLAYGLLAVAVRLVFGYAETTALPVLLFSLCVVPDGLAYVSQAVLMGQRRFLESTVVLTAVSILKLAVGVVVLSLGYGLASIAWVWLSASCLSAMALLVLTVRQVGGLHLSGSFNWHPLRDNWRAALAFIMISSLLAFEAQTDTLVLSKFQTEAQVGWYNAATTLAYGLLVFSQAYRFSVYPLMTRYALQSREKLAALYGQSLRYVGAAVLPMAAGLLILAPQIVRLAFGSGFVPTVVPLQLLSFALLFIFLNEPTSRMMLVGDRQRQMSWFLVFSTLANITLNLVLTPVLGATGAALARLSSSCLFFMLNFSYVRLRLASVNVGRLLVPVVLAVLLMGLLVWTIRGWPLYFPVSVGVASYVSILVMFDREVRSDLATALRLVIKIPKNR